MMSITDGKMLWSYLVERLDSLVVLYAGVVVGRILEFYCQFRTQIPFKAAHSDQVMKGKVALKTFVDLYQM